MRSSTESGGRLGTMIGTSSGAKRNRLIGSSKSTVSSRTWGSTTSEAGTSSVARTCSIKTSRSLSAASISRTTRRSPTSTISFPQLFFYQVNTLSSTRNSKRLRTTPSPYGSWNLYISTHSDIEVSGQGDIYLQPRQLGFKVEVLQSGQSSWALRLPALSAESVTIRRSKVRHANLRALRFLPTADYLSVSSRICQIYSLTIRQFRLWQLM